MVKSVFLFIFVFTLNGCAANSIIFSLMKDEPVIGKMYIHESPRVGDKAVFYSPNQDRAGYVTELVAIENGLYKVHWYFNDESTGRIRKQLFVTREGEVKRAELVNLDSGEAHPLVIARVGDSGFLLKHEEKIFITPQLVKIGNKQYTVTSAVTYNIHHQAGYGFGDMRATTIELISPEVPFGVVKSVQDLSLSQGLMDYLDIVFKLANPSEFRRDSVLNDFLERLQQGEVQLKQEYVIKEHE